MGLTIDLYEVTEEGEEAFYLCPFHPTKEEEEMHKFLNSLKKKLDFLEKEGTFNSLGLNPEEYKRCGESEEGILFENGKEVILIKNKDLRLFKIPVPFVSCKEIATQGGGMNEEFYKRFVREERYFIWRKEEWEEMKGYVESYKEEILGWEFEEGKHFIFMTY